MGQACHWPSLVNPWCGRSGYLCWGRWSLFGMNGPTQRRDEEGRGVFKQPLMVLVKGIRSEHSKDRHDRSVHDRDRGDIPQGLLKGSSNGTEFQSRIRVEVLTDR